MQKSKGIITKFQKEFLVSFSKVKDSNLFYLTGGTALADFYLGHRISFDLDIFTTEKEIVIPFSRLIEQELKENFSINCIRRFQSFVDFEISKLNEKIRVQLAYDSPFRFEEPVDTNIGIKVNNYNDLIVDKLLAFFGRVEPRDAVDLFYILQKEKLLKLAELARKKDPGFDLYWFAIALNKVKDFPDEINRWPVEMLIETDASEIKKLFLKLSRQIMDSIKNK